MTWARWTPQMPLNSTAGAIRSHQSAVDWVHAAARRMSPSS
jgi:hypothetical protein